MLSRTLAIIPFKEKQWNTEERLCIWRFIAATFETGGWCQMLFSVYSALEIKEQVLGRALPSAGNAHSWCKGVVWREPVLLLGRRWHACRLDGFFCWYPWSQLFQAYSWLPQHCWTGRRGSCSINHALLVFLGCNRHKKIRGVESMCYLQKMMRFCLQNGRLWQDSVFQNKFCWWKKNITDAKMDI